MKKITKFLAAVALFAGFSATLASCHDHDEVCSDGSGNSSELVSNEQTAEALLHILYNTTDLDTLPSNWTSSSFVLEPTCGELYDESTPRVRTIVAESPSEAVSYYRLLTNQDGDTYATSWSHDSIGTITLHADSSATSYGTIDLNVRQLNLDQIRFVPASALGNNWAYNKWKPRYHFGDVLEVTRKDGGDNQTPEYWLCIRGEFSDENISGDCKLAHWVCFTLDDKENVDHRSGDITIDAPKNMTAENEYLRFLPRLLQIICSPRKAWANWADYTGNLTATTRFFDSPFPKGYLNENDFVRISENIQNAFSTKGGIKTLIPALGSEDGASLATHISEGKPLVFLSEGVSYPSGWRKYNPVTFKNLRKYSGKGYSDYTKYNVKYEFTDKINTFDIRKLVSEPYYGVDKFVNLYNSLVAGSHDGTRLLVVRFKSADKFEGIQNPKNRGGEYSSTKLKFKQIVEDVYEDAEIGHQGSHLYAAADEEFLPGDIVRSKTHTSNVPVICVGSLSDKVKGSEIFASDIVLDNVYKCTLDKDGATRILLNMLNGYIQNEKSSYIAKVYQNWDMSNIWDAYGSALTEMRANSNKVSQSGGYTADRCMLDYYFTLRNTANPTVRMKYTENGEEKLIKLEYDYSTKKYIRTTSAVDGDVNSLSFYQFYNNDASFVRVANVGGTQSNRAKLIDVAGKVYSLAQKHMTDRAN